MTEEAAFNRYRVTNGYIQSLKKTASYWQIGETTTTVCALTLLNGLVVIGKSACVDEKSFNAELGERLALENAVEKVWELEGYKLRDKLHNTAVEVEKAARLAHEVNRLYDRVVHPEADPQLPWDDAPDWQRVSARVGVWSVFNTPTLTPKESHQKWMDYKLAKGWCYGPEKDPERKTHPCILPYEDLPERQQVKDALFTTIVQAFIPDYSYLEAHSNAQDDTPQSEETGKDEQKNVNDEQPE